MGGCEQARWRESTLQKPLSSPRGQEGLRFRWVLRSYAKFFSSENAGYKNAVMFQLPHAGTAVKEAYAKRRLFRFSGCETRPFFFGRDTGALCGTSCRSQETWRRCSWKIAQIALRSARRTSELVGVADSEGDDCFRFQARQEQALHLFPRRPRICEQYSMEMSLQ